VPFSQTTIRDASLAKGAHHRKEDSLYKRLLLKDSACQTDFEGSLLYDSMVTMFRGHN